MVVVHERPAFKIFLSIGRIFSFPYCLLFKKCVFLHRLNNEKMKKFNTQKDAIGYFGHCWKYIENHYKVSRCYTTNGGFRGYFITTK